MVKKSRNQNKQPSSLWIVAVLIMIIGVTLTLQETYAEEDNDNRLETIYHVYLNQHHVGSVDSKEVVATFIEQSIEEKEEDGEHSYALKQEIHYIPERVFQHNTSNDLVLDQLEEEIIIQVAATGIQIGDEIVGYFAELEEAEQVIHEYKTQYVDEETLAILDGDQEEKKLSTNGSIILDVTLSEEVTYEEAVISEKDLLSIEEGIELLNKGTLEDQIHEVVEGNTLSSIAANYNLTVETLIELNPSLSEESLLQLGQEINVTDYAPFVDVIVIQEELVEQTISYQKETKDTDELFRGESSVTQSGQDGKKEVHYELEIVNGKVTNREVLNEEIVKEAVNEITLRGTKVIPSRGTGDFAWPAVGGRVTSHYGPRWGSHHDGIDIAGVSDRSIIASDNGVVEYAGWHNGGYGNKVIINHNNGYKTVYAHLESIDVSVGQTVPKGTTIGIMGTTGRSTGIHLHFEVYRNGSTIDPMSVLQ
ncbi:murein DD-endopeptidase MepM/ murein hydrolase activator NlpD [Natronobacillus azotifigens]|uniref:M23 family metallopeptidase n=1 Tax=Natronobacillus azotifigens TaxID=472978 RepID=A0A9J6R992_9BACI|nr:M23 family metallopeptidase [Natronobacillus azotifigens]MCZ0702242.1 M23 family metallopeptidase [Natronobacillus azotifigens]